MITVALATALATAIVSTIGPSVAANFCFLFAILTSAWIGGYAPGLLSCILSVFLAPFIVNPNFTFDRADWSRFLLILPVSMLASHLASQRRHAETTLRAMNAELDGRVRERTKELDAAMAAISEREERQRRAAEAGKVGLWEWDIVNNRVTWSELIYELHGLDPASFAGTVEAFGELAHPQDRQKLSTTLGDALAGKGYYQADYRPMRPDGQHRWLSTSGRVTFDEAGVAVFMRGAVVDVTERRDAEEALRRTNEELEEFASVASHDLQEPLRQVAIFSQLVQQSYGSELDADAREYLNYCVEGAHRMRALVDDLLNYSRTARSEQPAPAPVDLNALLTRVEKTLAGRMSETGAEIIVETLPVVTGHEVLLGQLWQNLLGNALTYRSEAAPLIRISSTPEPDGWAFAVADNGIGIAPEYHEQIFRIFQRLHDRETYSGTGIGLAICKKIVERHGGRIWVESALGAGATFRFTLSR